MNVHSKYLDEAIELPTTAGKEGKILYTHEGFEDLILNKLPTNFETQYDITIEHAEKGYVVARCVIQDVSGRKTVAVGDADSADVAAIRAFDRAAMAYLGVGFPDKGTEDQSGQDGDSKPAPVSQPAEDKRDTPPSQAKKSSGGFSLDAICTSGKYKAEGKTYRQIAEDYPDYVEWCASKGFAPWVQVAEAVKNG